MEQFKLSAKDGPANITLRYNNILNRKDICDITLKEIVEKNIAKKHTYLCNVCKKCFSTKEDLKIHRNKHLEKETSKKYIDKEENLSIYKKYQCHICFKSFTRKFTLQEHIGAKHTNDLKYKCNFCNFSSPRRSTLQSHLISHSELNLNCVCPVCGSHFKKKASFKNHLLSHANAKSFCCDQCDKKFTLASRLRTHMIQVHGGKSFQCVECDKAFPTVHRLNRHMLIHTGAKPFSCCYCNHCANTQGNLMKHVRVMHGKMHDTYKDTINKNGKQLEETNHEKINEIIDKSKDIAEVFLRDLKERGISNYTLEKLQAKKKQEDLAKMIRANKLLDKYNKNVKNNNRSSFTKSEVNFKSINCNIVGDDLILPHVQVPDSDCIIILPTTDTSQDIDQGRNEMHQSLKYKNNKHLYFNNRQTVNHEKNYESFNTVVTEDKSEIYQHLLPIQDEHLMVSFDVASKPDICVDTSKEGSIHITDTKLNDTVTHNKLHQKNVKKSKSINNKEHLNSTIWKTQSSHIQLENDDSTLIEVHDLYMCESATGDDHVYYKIMDSEVENIHTIPNFQVENIHTIKNSEVENIHAIQNSEVENIHTTQNSEVENIHTIQNSKVENIHTIRNSEKIQNFENISHNIDKNISDLSHLYDKNIRNNENISNIQISEIVNIRNFEVDNIQNLEVEQIENSEQPILHCIGSIENSSYLNVSGDLENNDQNEILDKNEINNEDKISPNFFSLDKNILPKVENITISEKVDSLEYLKDEVHLVSIAAFEETSDNEITLFVENTNDICNFSSLYEL